MPIASDRDICGDSYDVVLKDPEKYVCDDDETTAQCSRHLLVSGQDEESDDAVRYSKIRYDGNKYVAECNVPSNVGGRRRSARKSSGRKKGKKSLKGKKRGGSKRRRTKRRSTR